MPFPVGTYINQIKDPAVRAEFEQLYSLFLGYLSHEHKDSGAHGAVTADSVTVSGAATVAGATTLNGTTTVTAPATFTSLVAITPITLSGTPLTVTAPNGVNTALAVKGTDGTAILFGRTGTTGSGSLTWSTGSQLLLWSLDHATAYEWDDNSGNALLKISTAGINAATNGFQVAATRTIANAGTYDFPNGSTPRGFLFITSEADNATAIFQLRGGTGSTSEVSDPVGLFSAVSGTATSTNVFWNAGTNAYRIENNRGGSRTYELVLIGAGII